MYVTGNEGLTCFVIADAFAFCFNRRKPETRNANFFFVSLLRGLNIKQL